MPRAFDRPERSGDKCMLNHAEDLLRTWETIRVGKESCGPTARRRSSACAALGPDRVHAGAGWGRSGCGTCCTRNRTWPRLGALTGNQAVQQVQAGLQGDLRERLAGGGRRQPGRPDVSRPEPVSRQQRARGGARHQQAALLRADQVHCASSGRRRNAATVLAMAPHRGRCRGGLRRSAQCVRTDEGA